MKRRQKKLGHKNGRTGGSKKPAGAGFWGNTNLYDAEEDIMKRRQKKLGHKNGRTDESKKTRRGRVFGEIQIYMIRNKRLLSEC